ncbi:hypothetical protein B0A48_18189 [Cryoendolithus antarcticus]|uniref:Uncharacterized protein n=1 Tax=Cryoendolithus antarcticus TaxID=1507870 RepID=A0A1V8S919_9PEZI|nr:hypothetical protein B0A48_18189 [Cryoendolithus antarcticus]
MDSRFEKVGATSQINPVESPYVEKISSQPEKSGVTSNTTAVPGEDDTLIKDNEAAFAKPDRDLAKAVWTIVCGVALPCIPVIVISAVLIWFILSKQVKTQRGWPDFYIQATTAQRNLNVTETIYDWRHMAGPALFTQRNPSTITTIASWTSRVIPYLTSSIMALVAFFAARRIIVKSQRGEGVDLPSPQQLTLLIGLLGGNSLEPLKDTLLHRYQHKRKLADPIPMAFTALFMITFLGLLIPLVDTWFGIATTPAIITQLYNITSGGASTFGRALSSVQCPNGPGDFRAMGGVAWISCNMHFDDQNPYGIDATLVGPDESARTALGYSAITSIANYTDKNGLTYHYLADKRADGKLDFKAHTFGITTQCKPITSHCVVSKNWPSVSDSTGLLNDKFECSAGFQANFTFPGAAQTLDAAYNMSGDVTNPGADGLEGRPSIGLAFSTNADLTNRVGKQVYSISDLTLLVTNNLTSNETPLTPAQMSALQNNPDTQFLHAQNPLNFATWATGYPTYDTTLVQNGVIDNPLLNDTEIYRGSVGGNTKWIVQCSATVYNVTYAWANGSVHSFDVEVSNPEMGGFMSAPFGFHLDPAANVLASIASLAALQNTSKDLADVFANGWANAALALSVGTMDPQANVIEQVRNSTIAVARVPIAPLSLLLGLKLLYVVAVILLALGAYCFTHPAETEVVKTQLSAKGLAAAHFDAPDMLQSNVVRELGQRLQPAESPTEEDPRGGGLKRAVTLAEMEDKRIGVVADANGAWGFAVVANGVWNGIKPIATDIIGMEASQGNLGTAGQLMTAWKK